MSIFPKGLELVRDEEPIPVRICRADPAGPWFVIHVNRVSASKFRAVSQRYAAPAGTKPGSKAAKLHEAKFVEAFCRTSLAGWEGLTLDNYEELVPGSRFSGEAMDDWRSKRRELPFSMEVATDLYRDTWPDKFSDLIIRAMKEGVEEAEAEDEDRKEP